MCCFSYFILQNDLSDIGQTRKQIGVFDLERVSDFLWLLEKGWYRTFCGCMTMCACGVCVCLFKVTSLIWKFLYRLVPVPRTAVRHDMLYCSNGLVRTLFSFMKNSHSEARSLVRTSVPLTVGNRIAVLLINKMNIL